MANITWANDISGIGAGTWALSPRVIPAESSVATNTWQVPDFNPLPPEDNESTIAVFEQTLTASSDGNFNFGGRTITETFPSGGSGDTCHFSRSKWPYFIPTAAQPFVIDVSDNSQYKDEVGLPADRINYYRSFQQAPCDMTTTQVMTISTSSGNKSYATNAMDLHIDPVSITDARTAHASQTKTWGMTQAQYEKGKTAGQIVADWLFVHGL